VNTPTSRWLVLGTTAAIVLSAACGRGQSAASADDPTRGPDPKHHASDGAARMRALRLTHAEVRRRLGPHRWEARHTVSTAVAGKAAESLTETFRLECGAGATCHGLYENSAEYGQELFHEGDVTFFRQRYQRFLRFTEEPEETALRLEGIWGIVPATAELLGRFLALSPQGSASAAGRPGQRYRLDLRSVPLPAPTESGSRAWRAKLRAEKLAGTALLDRATGVPLQVTLSYTVTAPRDGVTVTIQGELQATVTEAGKPVAIALPKDFDEASPRTRDALVERRLLGNLPRNPGWFRGGGPKVGGPGGKGPDVGGGAGEPRPGGMRPRAAGMAPGMAPAAE
jgi:hypothetical protein